LSAVANHAQSTGSTPRGRSSTTLARVSYRDLNARQKENFNFQKVSAVLADYGFATIRLSDDWQGADFIAQHVSGDVLRVQLKGRLAFSQKYRGKGLFVAFADGDAWYLYPHDEVLSKVLARTKVGATRSWRERGGYTFAALPRQLRTLLEPYRISGSTRPIPE
jgi:hypothetical protein